MLYNINDYFDKLQIAGIDIPIGMRMEAFKAIDIMGSFVFDSDSVKVWENLRDDIFSAIAIREKDELIASMIFVKHFRVGDYSTLIKKKSKVIIRNIVKNQSKKGTIEDAGEEENTQTNEVSQPQDAVDSLQHTTRANFTDTQETYEENNFDTELEGEDIQNGDSTQSIASLIDDMDDIVDEIDYDEINFEDDTDLEDEGDDLDDINDQEELDEDKFDKFAKGISKFGEAIAILEDAGYEIDTTKSADSIANDIWQIRNAISSDLRGKKNLKKREELFKCLDIVRQHKTEEENIEKEIIGDTIQHIERLEEDNAKPDNIQYVNVSQIPETKLILEVERIANEIVTDRSRDLFISESGNEIDLFDAIIDSMSNMRGAVSNIFYYQNDRGKAKFLIVCDLSGSMGLYINMTLNLMLNMRKIIDDIQITAFSNNDAILTETVLSESVRVNGNWKDIFNSIFGLVPSGGTDLIHHLDNLLRWNETGRIKIDDETKVIFISDMLATDVPGNYNHETPYHPEIAKRLIKIKHICNELVIFSPSGNSYRYSRYQGKGGNVINLEQYRVKLGIRYAIIDTLGALRKAIISLV